MGPKATGGGRKPRKPDTRIRAPRPTKADEVFRALQQAQQASDFEPRQCSCTIFGRGIEEPHTVRLREDWDIHQRWANRGNIRNDAASESARRSLVRELVEDDLGLVAAAIAGHTKKDQHGYDITNRVSGTIGWTNMEVSDAPKYRDPTRPHRVPGIPDDAVAEDRPIMKRRKLFPFNTEDFDVSMQPGSRQLPVRADEVGTVLSHETPQQDGQSATGGSDSQIVRLPSSRLPSERCLDDRSSTPTLRRAHHGDTSQTPDDQESQQKTTIMESRACGSHSTLDDLEFQRAQHAAGQDHPSTNIPSDLPCSVSDGQRPVEHIGHRLYVSRPTWIPSDRQHMDTNTMGPERQYDKGDTVTSAPLDSNIRASVPSSPPRPYIEDVAEEATEKQSTPVINANSTSPLHPQTTVAKNEESRLPELYMGHLEDGNPPSPSDSSVSSSSSGTSGSSSGSDSDTTEEEDEIQADTTPSSEAEHIEDDVDDEDDADEAVSDEEQMEIIEEIQAQIAEEHARNQGSLVQENGFYRRRKGRPSNRDMTTLALGDIASRYRIPRVGVNQVRDWAQVSTASAVRQVLQKLKGDLTAADGTSPLTDDKIDEVTEAVLDSRPYKPGDGRAFYELISQKTGFSSKTFDCCPKSCVSYSYYPDADECPECGTSRWKFIDPLDPTKKVAAKKHVYFPIRHRLLLWYTSKVMSRLLKTYKRKATSSNRKNVLRISDMWSAKLYRIARKKGYFEDDRELAFCCGFDGTKAFKTRKNRTIWPIILTCMNIPPEIRYKRRNIIIAGFVPGPKGPKRAYTFFKPLVDEFEFLSNVGHSGAFDADGGVSESEGKTFKLKAHLMMVSTDMQARSMLMETMGFGSSSFCEYCTMKGLNYGGLHCPHKPPDNLDENPWIVKSQRNKRKKGRPCYLWTKDYTASNARLRNNQNFREIAAYAGRAKTAVDENGDLITGPDKLFAEETGISGESIFAKLSTIHFPFSFPPCTMHLYYENVVQSVFEHYAGRFFVKRPPPPDPRLQPDGTLAGPDAQVGAGPGTVNERQSGKNTKKPRKPSTEKRPAFKRREGKNEKFLLKPDEPYNIPPVGWKEIGRDTAHSNKTYPDQLGEEMVNLTEHFRRMKAANWQRFLFHQSPIYFRKYLPKEHYDEWMNMVEAMRLSTRKSLSLYDVDEIKERFFQFVAYYEKTFYQYDADRVVACLPSIHQLRHIHEAILMCGPTYVYAQWCMERVNGMITSCIKSKTKPDENIATIIELDIHCSLLPYVIGGLDSITAKRDSFCGKDGRLLLHKVFRHYVRNNELEIRDDADEEDDLEHAPATGTKQKELDPNKLHPLVLESFLTSEELDMEQLQAEFGPVSPADIRRAIKRIGDVTLVNRVSVKPGRCLLNAEELEQLLRFLREYYPDRSASEIDNLFIDPNRPAKGMPTLLREGRYSPAIQIQKWKNVRFENATRLADFVIDRRVVRICGSHYPRENRTRSASFFEFSTDTSRRLGSHTAGDHNRSASSHPLSSNYRREFGEAKFFLTVDIDWELVSGDHDTFQAVRGRELYLSCISPIAVDFKDGLTIVKRKAKAERSNNSSTNNRKYIQPTRWIDVEDFVDIVGLVYCKSEEYVCWRDGCWDPVVRRKTRPLIWRYHHPIDYAGIVAESDGDFDIWDNIMADAEDQHAPLPTNDDDEYDMVAEQDRSRPATGSVDLPEIQGRSDFNSSSTSHPPNNSAVNAKLSNADAAVGHGALPVPLVTKKPWPRRLVASPKGPRIIKLGFSAPIDGSTSSGTDGLEEDASTTEDELPLRPRSKGHPNGSSTSATRSINQEVSSNNHTSDQIVLAPRTLRNSSATPWALRPPRPDPLPPPDDLFE